MKQRPSFQFYPQDFLGSVDVQMMSAEDVGCYCLLMFNCYNNGGELPNDPRSLNLLCRGTSVAKQVLEKFYIKNEKLRHKRIDEELQKQTKFSKTQSKNAQKRWQKAKVEGMPSHSHGTNSASNRQCSSSSSSSSISNKEKIPKRITPKMEMENFIKELHPYQVFVEKYGIDFVRAFLIYWCESSMDGTKQRWQMQKTWSLSGRLSTWAKNQKQFSPQPEERKYKVFTDEDIANL